MHGQMLTAKAVQEVTNHTVINGLSMIEPDEGQIDRSINDAARTQLYLSAVLSNLSACSGDIIFESSD
jgi:hypothetical protein